MICISAPPAALDGYLAPLPAMSLIPFAPFRFLISETLRVLLYQCSTLKPGFNGRHNHFYSSSCLRLEHGVFFVRARAIGEKELLAQVQCLCLYLHRLVVTGRRRRYGAGGMADGAQRAGYNDCGNRTNVRQSSRRSWRATKQARKLAGFQNKL
jgi:hypothetical protein